ncbi:MAG TPA: energy transducer TonB [Steroidobacteraceae bacterium]|jgi:TonB family protein|nr:energy transducer TonB [Steroidobacteraceae bacterium]
MTRPLVLLTLLLAACAPKGPSVEVAARLAKFDPQYQAAWREARKLGENAQPGYTDMRGRTIADDLEQWVFAASTEARIRVLINRAGKADGDDGRVLLDEADQLIRSQRILATQINEYWTASKPAPYWRGYWQAFFEENEVVAEGPDIRLIAAEKPVVAALERGDFSEASFHLPALASAFRAALADASRRVTALRKKKPLHFQQRRAPCLPGAKPAKRTQPAKVFRGDDVDSIYPSRAKKRGEEGSVVLQVRIQPNGCATAAAVSLHSGVPELDAAALRWYESAQFAAAVRDGVPYLSDLRFKMKFVIKN